MKNGVELLGQAHPKVVTHPLGLRAVDDANCALEPRIAQRFSRRSLSQQEEESTHPRVVEQPLVAVSYRRPHPFTLRRLIPVRGCCDTAGMGGESHQKRPVAVRLSHKLPEIELANVPILPNERSADSTL